MKAMDDVDFWLLGKLATNKVQQKVLLLLLNVDGTF
jgi:hypothetical protein